ncbi:NADH-quinone oxidoreductase subunit NuoF [Coxiella-like endosymbiont of Amblyomma americanum]|uniref:NADH-quinone oxidoreductase subunit NuoF n=1 Tax=Coxiella-like endosymbiont of Amblyomma americanum TaxID=1987500 RepID=UPI000F89E00A|nr:NADH-quinone oxidoreductase subunit NuoF [Coxiella-like endosymbiont of Amblyomma americanum]AUJ59018.1 NADH-quinone oxidoreductase subunit F [Coxiella-like endosymbiont of Amblyomma americanum]
MLRNMVCYRTLHLPEPWTLESYRKIGGYKVLQRLLKEKTPSEKIINEIKISCLRGRGGAGFLTGLKWEFFPRNNQKEKYVICNSDESEPGTFKDRDILRFNPHQVLEGIAISCYTLGVKIGYNFLRGEFWEPFNRCEQALLEARNAGLIGKNVLNSGIDIEIYNHRSAGAYVCGEETALINSLEGKRGWPRFKPPFPANSGLYGCPSIINNTETFASIPVILEKGGKWFADLGVLQNGGTKIFSVSGHVIKPGNYEVPLGTPFADLLELAGGMLGGSELKAVIPGGSSMPVLPAHIMMKVVMSFDGIIEAGSMLGSGGVIIMNQSTCMVQILERISKFYMRESCGQCTPCREGTGWIYRLVYQIERGEGTKRDLMQLSRVAKGIAGRTICAFGEAASWPVSGMLRHFYDEFLYHIQHGKCMV